MEPPPYMYMAGACQFRGIKDLMTNVVTPVSLEENKDLYISWQFNKLKK